MFFPLFVAKLSREDQRYHRACAVGNDFALPTRVGFAFINDCSDKIFFIRLKIKFASSSNSAIIEGIGC